MPPKLLVAAVSIAALLSASACGVASPSQNTIEEFSGEVDPGGNGGQYDFTVRRNGEYAVKLVALEPSTDVFLSLTIAQYVGGACQQLVDGGFGALNVTALVGPIYTGRYCVAVFDRGLITERVKYTVQVSHP